MNGMKYILLNFSTRPGFLRGDTEPLLSETAAAEVPRVNPNLMCLIVLGVCVLVAAGIALFLHFRKKQ